MILPILQQGVGLSDLMSERGSVCVCVCEREREREWGGGVRENE